MFFKTHSSVSWERAVLSGLTGLKNNVRMQSEIRIKGSAPYAFHGALHYHYIKYNIYIESPSCACFVSSILCFESFCCTCNHFVKPVLSCTICTTSPIGRRWKPDVTWVSARRQTGLRSKPKPERSTDANTEQWWHQTLHSCVLRKLQCSKAAFMYFFFFKFSFPPLICVPGVFQSGILNVSDSESRNWRSQLTACGDEPGSKVRLC